MSARPSAGGSFSGQPGLSVQRLQRPSGDLLGELERYDLEAFGATGLRTYDLAVMAEAGAVFAAYLDGSVVGGCQLMRELDQPDFLYVVGFYVRPPWQGRGIGRAFLLEIERWAHELEADGLVLTVAPGNQRALSLYESAGFTRDRFIPGFYGEGQDRFILRWRFLPGDLQGSV
jgi:ribosomal protein S18 acetylase RimI-like enzyme